jgi:hypothetical protein
MNAAPAISCRFLRPWEETAAGVHGRCRDRGCIGGDCRDGDCRDGGCTYRGPGSARGAVTAEFAVALPAVLMLLALLLGGAAAGVTQLRLEEAARAGARALARGEEAGTVSGIVRTLAGASATAAIAADGDWLSITVSDRTGGPLGAAIPWTLSARASTRTETAVALPLPGGPAYVPGAAG